MNELIQELANKATSYCDTLDVADQTIYQDIWKREFAELIVKECASFSDKHNQQKLYEDYTLGVGKAIKKHFGVEQ